MAENDKLGSGAMGLTSQSQQIMKAFPSDQKRGGCREKDQRTGEKGGWMRGKGGGGLVLHNLTHATMESCRSLFCT